MVLTEQAVFMLPLLYFLSNIHIDELMLQAHVVTATEAAHAAQGMAAAVGSTNLGPGQDQITDALSKMPRAALYDIMAQMKGLIQQNQQQARQILVTNPSLTRALFQAQILLGMLKNPLSSDAIPPQAPPQGPPQQQPGPMPGPAPQQQPQQQQQQQQQHYQLPQVPQQQQQQHAPAMRPQQVPPNTSVQYPPQDMQGPPQQGLPGAPQPLRNPHGQSMAAMPGKAYSTQTFGQTCKVYVVDHVVDHVVMHLSLQLLSAPQQRTP